MIRKETLRYLENNDTSTITYKNFASSAQDTYPSFSICFIDAWQGGALYSYFKDDIASTLKLRNADYSTFAGILKGQKFPSVRSNESTFDIRNISETYANVFTIHLNKLYRRIKFDTENINDSIKLSSFVHDDKVLPFYVSYQDPERVCFTRNDDKREKIMRVEDELTLLHQQLKRFHRRVTFNILIHHPGQLLRGFDVPVFDSRIQSREIGDWPHPSLTFKISQVSVLRKRPHSNTPCNPDLYDDDIEFMMKVSDDLGCIPLYWKRMRIMSLHYDTCKTPEELREVWTRIKTFKSIHSMYAPPCNDMKTIVYSIQDFTPNSDGFSIYFKYMDRSYQEITNHREFGLESLWSTAGGIIGIFVGISLAHIPNIVTSFSIHLRNLLMEQ